MNKDIPTWEFDRVELTYLRVIMDDNGLKSRNRCYASIDFGFFIVMDVGLTLERKYDQITWSNDFGWSKFRFNMSQIGNPYYEEVIKVMRMIKKELDRKHDIIVDFLNDQSTTAPKIIRDKYD